MKQDLLEEINNYLLSKGFNSFIFEDNVIAIKYLNSGNVYYLKCLFPKAFPNVFPEIYLSNELYELVKKFPHIGNDKKVCTFDPVKNIPNRDEPLRATYEVVKNAVSILDKGFTGSNYNDFNDEFLSYWDRDMESEYPFVIFGLGNEYKNYCYIVDNKYVYSVKPSGKSYLKRKIITIDSKKLINVNLTVEKLVSICGPSILDGLDFSKENYMLVKIENDNNIIYSMFKIPIFKKVNGFRLKTISSKLLFLNKENLTKKVQKYACINCTQDYFYKRGGDGRIMDKKILIIGCGSIGGYLADYLSDLGYYNFVFVDNDIVTNDNIARHICGFDAIGKNKAESLKQYMLNKNPNINCKAYGCDGFEYINNYSLSNFDYVFDATANYNLLLELFDLKNNNTIVSPILSLWVEPFCACSHCVVIKSKLKIENLFLDNNCKYNVLTNGADLSKRLGGCQSTFFQYSAFGVKMFLCNLLKYLFLEDKKEINYLYSFIGNVSSSKSNGAIFKDNDITSYSERIIEL